MWTLPSLFLSLSGCSEPEAPPPAAVCDDPSACAVPASQPAELELARSPSALVASSDRLFGQGVDGFVPFDLSADGPAAPGEPQRPGELLVHAHDDLVITDAAFLDATDFTEVAAAWPSSWLGEARVGSGAFLARYRGTSISVATFDRDAVEVVAELAIDPGVACDSPDAVCVSTVLDVSPSHVAVQVQVLAEGIDAEPELWVLDHTQPAPLPWVLDDLPSTVVLGDGFGYALVGGALVVLDLVAEQEVDRLDDALGSLALGEVALVGTTAAGLQVYDLADPLAPVARCAMSLEGGSLGTHRVATTEWGDHWFGARLQSLDWAPMACVP